MSYLQLAYGKVKSEKTVKSNNFPKNHNFSVLFPQLRYSSNIDDLEIQHELISTIKNINNLQRYS